MDSLMPDKDIVYCRLEEEINDDLMHSKKINQQEGSLDNFVLNHASKLVESVLVSANAWVLVTQVEAYISNNMHLDNCAF
jgi:hypothetical protein